MVSRRGQTRSWARRGESYLALVTLVFPSFSLRTTRRAILASGGPLSILELTDATARAAQRAEFSCVGPSLALVALVHPYIRL